jgi:hypothetical protein
VNCNSRQVDEASHAQAMSPERMARTIILQYVQKQGKRPLAHLWR